MSPPKWTSPGMKSLSRQYRHAKAVKPHRQQARWSTGKIAPHKVSTAPYRGKWKTAQANYLKPFNPANASPGATNVGKPKPPADPMPVDAQYIQDTGAVNRNVQTALGDYTYGSQQLDQSYGFKPTYNPAGQVASVAIDPSNPFSRAAELQRAFQNSTRGTTNQYAASGQLYSGALQNAQDEGNLGYQRNYNSLVQGYQGAQRQLFGSKQDALDKARTDRGQAFLDYVGRSATSEDAKQDLPKATAGAGGNAGGKAGGKKVTGKVGGRRKKGRVVKGPHGAVAHGSPGHVKWPNLKGKPAGRPTHKGSPGHVRWKPKPKPKGRKGK